MCRSNKSLSWQTTACPYSVSQFPNEFYGCNAICCQLIVQGGLPTGKHLYISLYSIDNNVEDGLLMLDVDEMRIFGSTGSVEDNFDSFFGQTLNENVS